MKTETIKLDSGNHYKVEVIDRGKVIHDYKSIDLVEEGKEAYYYSSKGLKKVLVSEKGKRQEAIEHIRKELRI